MPDKQIECVECKKPFVFTEVAEKRLHELVSEGKIQEYHEPRRCQPCRNARKQRGRSQGA
jgi:hypothetical protein